MSKLELRLAEALVTLEGGTNRDPFAVLGPHREDGGRAILVRAFYPAAQSLELRLVATGELQPMTACSPVGVWEAVVEPRAPHERREPWELDYRLRVTFPDNHVLELD